MENKENKEKDDNVNEPTSIYGKRELHIFKSFEEQEEYELKTLAALSSEKILEQLRQLINLAYGMHGYKPNNLPKKHTIKILSGNK